MNGESKGNILVFCAHSDDQVLGAGGAMARYARNGYDVYTFIFSYGEGSHPHVQLKHIATTRVKESQEADSIIGGKGVFFFGAKDGNIKGDFEKRKRMKNLKDVLMKYKPVKVFTHSVDDMLPDHRGVRQLVLKAYDDLNKKEGFKCDVYTFDVWNLWNVRKREKPVLVVDITGYFKYKVKALHSFKSQISFFSHTFLVNFLYVGSYIKAVFNGLKHGYRFAEVFYKVR